MLGSKRRTLSDGVEAMAVVTHVTYATVLGMAEKRNFEDKLDLTLMVRPDAEAPFEAHVKAYFAPYNQPTVGDQFWVRYDPNNKKHVVIDQQRIAAENRAYEAQVAAAAASAVPADLAANGILGRGTLVDVTKAPAGSLVACTVTVGVRLVDGTPPYRATCVVPLSPDQAELLIPGQTVVSVRADPRDHSRIALSLQEPTPVVTITDPAVIDPPARAMREGTPCRVTVLAAGRQWLQTPEGNEFYAIKVRVNGGVELQINNPVPAGAVGLLQVGAELPARQLATEPNVLAIDWASAGAGSPVA
jgi:hypothetical protein